ncbi:MAG: M67 family metallopeptidase [Candidatus Acidiferrum sp.]
MAETNKLQISKDLAEKVRGHGAETYPHECCGALLGRDAMAKGGVTTPREILGLFPLVNQRKDSPHNRFSVTPLDVVNAEKAAMAGGWDVIGWYHSHPDHPAKPSEYDREHAWPWYSYVILSVQEGVPGKMTSWRLNEDRTDYLEETIEIRTEVSVKSGT